GEGVRVPGRLVQPRERARGRAGAPRRLRRQGARRASDVAARTASLKKGGSPNASRPRRWKRVRLPLPEPLALHVGPELLGHHGRSDGAAAEDLLHRVLAALEADRVPAERLPPLRHVLLLLCGSGNRPLGLGVLLPQVRGQEKEKYHPWGSSDVGEIPGWGIGGVSGLAPDARPQRVWNAGITSRANQRSCSLNSLGGRPSAQWIMKSSSPGYFAAMDWIPSMTCDGGPQNQAFCWMPSASVGTRAGAPGVPHVRPSASA